MQMLPQAIEAFGKLKDKTAKNLERGFDKIGKSFDKFLVSFSY
ncbi:hypothetical protein OFQ64_10120 [Brachyspira hyodysenteriae]|nr:hypothetical protein [Brachyspira hyodysenteriae]MCZ9979089.1 hypothetical protein [Brachyspira hyodysenteriae]